MVYIPSHISFAVYSVKVKTELNMKNCAIVLFVVPPARPGAKAGTRRGKGGKRTN